MKTTIELPDALFREVKLRAVFEGRKLKDVVADLLRRGLEDVDATSPPNHASRISRDERSGLPVILCRHPAAQTQRLTPDRVSDILLGQEAAWQDEARR
jgi:hypothetical protein